MTFLSINTFAKGGYTILANGEKQTWLKFKYELFDMFSGVAFPLMLQMILSATFIGMTSAFGSEDRALAIVLLCVGEVAMGVAYFIFGRQSGITSVRKLVLHTKKCEIGTTDRQALLGIGEYSAYKGFLIGFISCVPYIIFQIIQCAAPNAFCDFILQYVFGWAALPFTFAEAELSPWLNLLFILFPTAVHGVAYIICAHREWDRQQKVAELQGSVSEDNKEDK